MDVMLLVGEKKKAESKNAVIACNDFLRLGTGRTLPMLLNQYRATPQTTAPTLSINTLQKWSQLYDWQERAELWDAAIEAEKRAAEQEVRRQIAEERKAIMQEGVALDYRRVERLKRLAEELEAQIFYQPQIDPKAADLVGIASLLVAADETHDPADLDEIARRIIAKLDPNDPKNKFPHIWARDVKGLAGGRTVEVVRFNSALLAEYRAILDEIAKETGGRRQRTVNVDIDYSKLSDEQIERILAGEDEIEVVLSGFTKS